MSRLSSAFKLVGMEAAGRLLKNDSYLRSVGWFKSVRDGSPVDKDGTEVPWFTYPFIEFLKGRVKPEYDVFEYGAGASTVYFSKEAGRVFSVEHDPNWHEFVIAKLSRLGLDGQTSVALREPEPEHSALDRHRLSFTPSGGDYVSEINQHDLQFDVIIVDGVYRGSCCQAAINRRKPAGVIIVDNTNYADELSDGLKALETDGFRRIDFWGMCPVYGQLGATSVFYKDGNCFGI